MTQYYKQISCLAARARSAPHDPWLFYRDGLDWCWRSWSRIADQVARGAAVLRQWSSEHRRPSDDRPLLGFDARQDPDAIATGLAIRAAGLLAVPVTHGTVTPEEKPKFDVWVDVEGSGAARRGDPTERVLLPAALSPLERTRPHSLELDPGETPGLVGFAAGGEPRQASLIAAARRLEEVLPVVKETPIVCAAPDLDLHAARLVEAWTLLRGAAWVLEPDGDAFLATVLWARPTLVFGRAADLDRLAARLKVRKHRRRSRLSAVVTTEGLDAGTWDRLAIPRIDLPSVGYGR